MRNLSIIVLGGVLVAAVSACAPATQAPAATPAPATSARVARADSLRHSHVQADVDFMTGMIHHHAQALVMSRMAPTHGASPTIQTLTARIINGQKGEIGLMSRWLSDRDEPVPEAGHDGMAMGMHTDGHTMHGGDHHMSMPGMLSPEQMKALDAARGAEFDRLFLTYMIQHHQGALTMVNELFDTYGAAQADDTYKIASDISADQSSEIDRMRSMLAAMLVETGSAP